MNFGITEKSMKLILEAISQFEQIEKAVIFGSRAMGNYKNGSDVDIAVFGQEIDDNMVIRLSALLNEEYPLPYFFDVLDYKSIQNEELLKHIDEKGKLIYFRNE